MEIKPIRTGDGSFTIFSEKYDEHFHNPREGALSESLYKHVIPAITHLKEAQEINILDICFGIGFNTLATLKYIKEIGFKGKVNIYSPELDGGLIKSLKDLPYTQDLLEFLPAIYEISKTNRYNKENLSIEVFIGDAVEYVKTFQDKFDIIYQDAFSSQKNPELWSEEFFNSLFRAMRKGGVLTTYSQAKGVRKKLESAGFSLGEQQIDEKLNIRSGTLGFK